MIQDLENLIKLQEIDLRIHEQEMAQEKYPSQVIELQKEIDQIGSRLTNLNKRLETVKSDSQNVTDQISKGHELQEKSQDRLSSIKTNREYDAVHAEIEAQKNIMNTAEISKKNLEQEIEKLTASVAEISAEYEKVKATNEPQIKDLNEKIAVIDSNIAEITKERDAIVPKIGKSVMRTYSLIHKKRKTRRVISLISKSKNCTYCYKILEPQLYNEIRRGTKLILCQNCGSIMIWDENAATAQQS